MSEREVGPGEPEQQEKPGKKSPPQPTPIEVIKGTLVPRNSSELNRMIHNVGAGGGFPERFNTPEKRIAAYNLAHSLMGKKWQLALNHMAFIKGQLVIYGELPGTVAEHTKEVKEKDVYLVDENYRRICSENKNLDAQPIAAVCKIQRKGRALKEYHYTLEDAKKAGQYPPTKKEWKDGKPTGRLIPNDDSPWNTAFKVMLMRKAMAIGVKFEFPESMMGVLIAEYDFDLAPDIRDVQEIDDAAGPSDEFKRKIDSLD